MSDPVLFDAAFPGPGDPNVNGCLFYGGGDTPHVWTMAEIKAAPGRYRLFVWVRSNPQAVNTLVDVQACLNTLTAIGYPKGKAVLLDLETAVDQAYVNTFGQLLHAAGYLVWDYGSTSTLFRNPALDGYFPSDPTGIDHVAPGWVGCQFSFNGSYDLDDVTRPDLLWDLQPAPQPPAPFIRKQVHMFVAESDDAQPKAFVIFDNGTKKYITTNLDVWLKACGQTSLEPLSGAELATIPDVPVGTYAS